MLLGLLLSGAMLYTSANLIAYDEVVDRVKNQQEKNKERKGFKKGLVGLGNTLAKVTFFPAFISKNVVKNSGLESKIRNLGKKKGYSEERIEKTIEIAKSKKADTSEKLSTKDLVKYSDELVSSYINNVEVMKKFDENIQNMADDRAFNKRIENDYYALENETEISKAITRRSINILLGYADGINVQDDLANINNHKDLSNAILSMNENYQGLKENIEYFQNQIAHRINKKYETTKKEMEEIEKEYNDTNVNISSNFEGELKALESIKNELTNKGLDEVEKHFEEKLMKVINENTSINNEVCELLNKFGYEKDEKRLKLTSFKDNCSLAADEITKRYEDPEDQLGILDELAILFEENNNKVNEYIYCIDVCKLIEKGLEVERKESQNENFDATSRTLEIIEGHIKELSNIKDKKEQLSNYEETLKNIKNDMSYFTVDEKEEIRSFGDFVLKGMLKAYFQEGTEDYNELWESVKLCMQAPFEKTYDLEVSCQEEIAERLALSKKISKEEAIKIIQHDYFTDLKLEQKEEKDVEPEEVKEEEIIEEVKSEETEPEEIKEEIKEEVKSEEVKDEEKPISNDLTRKGRKAIKTSPVTKVYRKVNYCKYHTLDLTEAEYNKLTEKQKYVYNLVNEYGKDGLPVGIFTALGIKMTQAKKVISPVGEKFEKDYNEEEASKVLKIVNEKLNNDLYLATNGNEKIKVVRYPIKSINVTKTRVEVIEDISPKYKVCLVKGLTKEQTEALKAKFGDKINIYNNYIIFNTKESKVVKETEKVLSKA